MTVWVLASLRSIAALVVIAALAAPLPRWLGIAIGGALGLLIAATLPPITLPAGTLELALVGLRELAIGAALGIAAVLPLVALGFAGRLIERSIDEPATRAIVLVVGAAVFVGIDGPVLLAESIARSYQAMPIAGDTGAILAPSIGVAIAGLAAAAARLAVPFVVGAAIIEIAIGVAARVADHGALAVLPWRRGAMIAVIAAGLTLVAVAVAGTARAAWSGG